MALTIKLVRHGESEANLRYDLVREIGDHAVHSQRAERSRPATQDA